MVGVPGNEVTLANVAKAARPGWDHGRPQGMAAGLEETYYFEPSTVTWSYASHAAIVDVMLPEMDGSTSVPEISTGCWSSVGKQPGDMMCATSRMIVKRKGAAKPVVVPCTLLPYDGEFEMATTLAASQKANGPMFHNGAVKLCHVHCAKFCVLGGGTCS